MSTAGNDDKSPLIDLISCVVCNETMKIEKSSPDAEGKDMIQYRCGLCNKIEASASIPPKSRFNGLKARGNDACCDGTSALVDGRRSGRGGARIYRFCISPKQEC